MSNKKLGNRLENDIADLLAEKGFWVHLMQQNSDGQPADIIAVRNTNAYLIDAKACATGKGFVLSRMEENQLLSMTRWAECGNGTGWFALGTETGIYMLSFDTAITLSNKFSAMSPEMIQQMCLPIREWVKTCK